MKYKSFKQYLSLSLAMLFMALVSAAQGIFIGSGTYMVANGSAYINIQNAGFKNDGTFTAGSSSVVLSGNTATANSFISGSATTVFNNLVLNKSANGLQLENNIAVNGTLDLQSGDSLFLNNNNIDLGTTGSVSGETSAKRITGLTGGYIQVTADLNEPVAVNPGNIAVQITSGANLGNTIIRRGHLQQSGASVNRYFDFIPANNSALNATISFYYFHQELASVPEGSLGMFSSTNGGTSWSLLGTDVLNTGLDFVTKGAVDQLNRLTLANIGLPLPVHLLYFKARLKNKQGWLDWATGSETNNNHFDVERSVDGRNFSKLGIVDGHSNSSVTQYYQYIDASPVAGINYYRLKQTDNDNYYVYSNIVKLDAGKNKMGSLLAYPNPASGMITLSFQANEQGDQLLQVADASGKTIESKLVYCKAGLNSFDWDISKFSPGIYFIRLAGSNLNTVQLLKN